MNKGQESPGRKDIMTGAEQTFSLATGIQTTYDEVKTAAAAGVLLEKAGGRMAYLKLMKLLYMADRRAWEENGKSISGDTYAAMPYGMVLRETLNHIRGKVQGREAGLSETVEIQGYDAVLAHAPDRDELAEAELQILDQVFIEFAAIEKWALVEQLHQQLPEWKDPKGSSFIVRPEELLELLGKSAEEIAEISHLNRGDQLLTAACGRQR